MKTIPIFVLYAVLLILNTLEASTTKGTVNTIKFNKITTVIVESLDADIQFVLSNDTDVSIKGESSMLSNLVLSPTQGTLKISAGSYAFGMPIKFQIAVPSTCLLDVSVVGDSHVFIPKTNAAVRLTLAGLSQGTVDACIGLVLTASGESKIQVNQIRGDMSVTLSDHSAMGIKEGELKKALITATEYSHVSIAALISSLNLITKGASDIKLAGVSKAFVWTGRGNGRVSIKRLSGVAEVTASYNSELTVEVANLETLLASASATGKIIIKGTVTNAVFSASGAGQIVVDKVTGKILRNSQMHNGTIKIVNP
ncbi:MAG: DUF2807 domain-containing protein [Alphaproteobacteria bacterium]|nr:DUF2807 domain-containing protein [Alphaproteobacteria bacterium]